MATAGNVSEDVARQYLTAENRNVARAVERYLKDQAAREGDRKTLNEIWERVRDSDEDALFEDKLTTFMDGIGADTEYKQMVVAWKIGCSTMGEIKRAEFVEGFAKLGCSTEQDMATMLSKELQNLQDFKYFKTFYRWFYKFVAASSGVKTLATKDVIYLWRVIGPHFPTSFVHMEAWLSFIKDRYKGIQADLWNSILDFAQMVPPNFEGYSVDDAWNTEIDEFVKYFQEQQLAQAQSQPK